MYEHIRTPPSAKRIRRICWYIGLVVFVLCGAIYISGPNLIQDIEGRLLDARFKIRGVEPVTGSVAIAAIDDSSLKEFGRWPWPRTTFAELVRKISEAGASIIVLDVVFSEAQNPLLLAELNAAVELDDQIVNKVQQALQNTSPDAYLAEAIKKANNVVGGFYFYTNKEALPQHETGNIDLSKAAVTAVKSKLEQFDLQEAVGVVSNIPQINQALIGAGYFNVNPGSDGVVRRIPLITRFNEQIYSSLSVMALSKALGGVPIVVHVKEFGVSHVLLGSEQRQTDEFGRLVLNYRGPAKTIPTYSAIDILNQTLPEHSLEDKIVVLGVPAIGIEDLRSTPFGPSFPGVEIQATLLENLIANDALQVNNLSDLTDLGTMLVIVIVLIILFPKIKGTAYRTLLALALITIYIVVNYQIFVHHQLWINLAYPLLAWFLAYTSLTIFLGVVVERTVSTVRAAFKSYLHPGIVDRIAYEPKLLGFGGEQKQLTILFSDIRNFTNLSETLTPLQLSRFLRCYMDPMTEQVFQSRGTLDKYIGDAVMAFFGAPYPSEAHPANACDCALGMVQRLAGVQNCCPELEHLFPLRIGIGIHSGEAVVGNFGSSKRFNYTVLGDNVNLASRLEGMSKVYGVDIVVSETTYEATKSDFVYRELDKVRVKGKERPVTLHELRGLVSPDQEKDFLVRWQEALMAYQQQHWRTALERFELLRSEHTLDKACDLYINRTKDYIQRPPPEDWDGVFKFDTK